MQPERSLSASLRSAESIRQIQCGPLKLTVPTSLTLRQKGRRNALQPRLAKFRGSLNITNKGNALVTFKVMSKHSKTLQVNPVCGFIESNHSISLNVFTKDATWLANRVTNFGLVILATTCEVTNLSSRPSELRLFWKKIVQEGLSCAFVELFKIEDFQFVDMHEDFLDVHPVNNLSDCSDTDGYMSSSSLYSSQKSGTDSEDGSSDSSRSGRMENRRKLCDTTIEEMNELTENMDETNGTLKSWSKFLLLFTIISFLTCLQRMLGGLELQIAFTRRKS